MNKRIIFGIVFLLAALVSPVKTSAFSESFDGSELRAVVSPTNPGPNEKTSIRLSSYLNDLDACDYEWKLGGLTVSSGIGEKNFSFTTAPLGAMESISVSVNCGGVRSEKKFVFQSNDADFLTVPDTYVPAFYRGGTRATPGSSVQVTVLPQVFDSTGKLIDSKNLIYRYSKDGRPITTSSGYGKNSVTIQTSDIKATSRLLVEIYNLSGELKTAKSLNLSVFEPQILLYPKKPLLGIQYQSALKASSDLEGEEITLVAEPFFMSNRSLAAGQLEFFWTMNGKAINSDASGRSLILRQGDGQSGQALISVSGRDNINLLSAGQTQIKINFGRTFNNFGF